MSNKVGRLSAEELEFIRNNAEQMTYEQIAQKLDRNVETIKRAAEHKFGKNLQGKSQILYNAKRDIENRPYWPQLEKQFSTEELELFTYHWGLMFDQMKEDVTHSEELQIVEVIKLEILSNRVLINQKIMMDNITTINGLVENEKNKDNPDNALLLSLERQLAGLYSGHDNLSKEHREFSNHKQSILKALKATREVRLKNVQDSKESILSWFRYASENTEERYRMGIEMEKMRLAMEVERQRLSSFHTYANGEIDQPLLTPDTLKE